MKRLPLSLSPPLLVSPSRPLARPGAQLRHKAIHVKIERQANATAGDDVIVHLLVGEGGEAAQTGLELLEGLVAPGVERGGVVAKPVPELDGDDGHASIRPRRVRHWLRCLHLHQQPPFVA